MVNIARNKFTLPYWIGTPFDETIEASSNMIEIYDNSRPFDSYNTLSSVSKLAIRPKYTHYVAWNKSVTNESHSSDEEFAKHWTHWQINPENAQYNHVSSLQLIPGLIALKLGVGLNANKCYWSFVVDSNAAGNGYATNAVITNEQGSKHFIRVPYINQSNPNNRWHMGDFYNQTIFETERDSHSNPDIPSRFSIVNYSDKFTPHHSGNNNLQYIASYQKPGFMEGAVTNYSTSNDDIHHYNFHMDYLMKIDMYGNSPSLGVYNSKTYFSIYMNTPRVLEIETKLENE